MSKNATRLRNPATGEYVTLNEMGQLVDQSGASLQAVYSASKTLTNAQMLALPPTPVEILPAPDENSVLSVVGGVSRLFIKTEGQYAASSTPGWQLAYNLVGHSYPASGLIQYGGSITDEAVADTTYLRGIIPPFFLIPSGDMAGFYASSFGAGTVAGSEKFGLAGKGIVLFDNDNDTGSPYTGGDPANTLKITVLYTIIDVS